MPFEWRYSFVPILTNKALELLEAPGTFMMGCHSVHIKEVEQVSHIVCYQCLFTIQESWCLTIGSIMVLQLAVISKYRRCMGKNNNGGRIIITEREGRKRYTVNRDFLSWRLFAILCKNGVRLNSGTCMLKIGTFYRRCVWFFLGHFVSTMCFILTATSIKRLNMPF